jgi:hypothetical protein
MVGCRHILVTFTLQHKVGDPLPRLLSALLGALRTVKGGSAWRDFARRVGGLGSVRSLEVTYGANGWHPHLHELAFFEGAVDLREIVGFLRSRWLAALSASGFTAGWLHGLDVRFASDQIVAYVAKWGHEPKWSAAHEVAKHIVKRRRGSFTPSDLLALAPSSARAALLWLEYAAAMHGLHPLQWSRGLRAKLGLPASECVDLAESTDSAILVLQISPKRWRRVVDANLRADILESFA